MCGVFGYVGQQTDVGGAILTALKTLEYRGYDSWGMALSTPDDLIVHKDVGRINGSVRAYPTSTLGIGHTRWATHGGVEAANSHPHLDCAAAHRGRPQRHHRKPSSNFVRNSWSGGTDFDSETDSDVVAHLVEEELAAGSDLGNAVGAVFGLLKGYNAVVVMDHLGQQFAAAKRVSPLVIGRSARGSTVASDAIALNDHADELIYLEDDQLAILDADSVAIFERTSMRPISPVAVSQQTDKARTGLAGYPDFLSKEIEEQPAALRRLVLKARRRLKASLMRSARQNSVFLVGCGTAGNAALAGTYFFDEICGRLTMMIPASEFRYRSRTLNTWFLGHRAVAKRRNSGRPRRVAVA